MKYCSYCGSKTDDDSAFCPYCGKKLDGGAVGTVAGNDNDDLPKINLSAPSLILKYADFMNDNALYEIALAKERGLLGKEEGEVEEIYRTLAFRGYPDGMYKYAKICLENSPEDRDIALRWFKLASDAGHEKSKNFLKTMKDEIRNPSMPDIINDSARDKFAMDENGKTHDAVSENNGNVSTDIGVFSDKNEKMSVPSGKDGFPELVKEALPSCLKVTAIKYNGKQKVRSSGSGFIVASGYVVTNAHVTGDNPLCVQADFEPSVDSRSYGLCPIAILPDYDVAVLSFSEAESRLLSKRKRFELRTDGIAFGEEVYTIGNPLGIGLSVSRGVVSSPSRESNYPKKVSKVIQTDITVNHGNSGGAMLDKNNKVIGMITFAPGDSEGGITMGVPASAINQILKAINEQEKSKCYSGKKTK